MSERPGAPGVVLVAGESAGVQALRVLTQRSLRVAMVVTDPAASNPVRRAAAAAGLPVVPDRRVRDPGFADEVRAEGVDLLLNVHSLRIAPPALIEAPRIGSFNLHPGPLPEYPGLNAPSWAIYHGEPAHGVTLHWMCAEVDAGPVAYAERFPIGPTDSALAVSLKCARIGVGLVERLLDTLRRDPAAIPRIEQDLTLRRRLPRRPAEPMVVDWSAPARRVVNLVRACDYHPFASPWGYPEAWIGGRRLSVRSASLTHVATAEPPGTVGRREGEAVWISAADEWVRVARVAIGDAVHPAAILAPRRHHPTDGATSPEHPHTIPS